MSHCCNIKAGENVYLEEKDDEFIIHCCPAPAPHSNIHTGFFQLDPEPEESSRLAIRIHNCIFRVNGRYYRIGDYCLKSYYSEKELIYLKLNSADPSASSIVREIVPADAVNSEDLHQRYFEDPSYILLYILNIRNNRLRAESYAAGGLIDTVLLPEGFVYALADGTVASSKSSSGYGFDCDDCIYVPGFDPVRREGINIKIQDGGGVLWISKSNKYSWRTTGFSASLNCTVTVTTSAVVI